MKKFFLSLIFALIPSVSFSETLIPEETQETAFFPESVAPQEVPETLSFPEPLIYSGLSAYASPTAYFNSSKKSGLTVGGYGYFNIGKQHIFEGTAGFSYTSSTSSLFMENIAFSYTNIQLENNSIRIGGQFLNSSVKANDQGVVMFLGDNYSFSENFAAGIEAYVSLYNYYTVMKPVVQVNPSITLTLGDFYSYGNFYLTLKGYYIKLPNQLAPGIILFRQNYFSGEASLSYNYFNIWNFSIYAWGGLQAFAVRNNGFLAFNSAEEHFAGYGMSVKYSLTENMALTAGVYNEHFKLQNTQINAMMLSIPIYIDYTF